MLTTTLGRRPPVATGITVSSSLELSCLDEELLGVCGGDEARIQPAAMLWKKHGGLYLVRSYCALVPLDQLTDQNHIQFFAFGEF